MQRVDKYNLICGKAFVCPLVTFANGRLGTLRYTSTYKLASKVPNKEHERYTLACLDCRLHSS